MISSTLVTNEIISQVLEIAEIILRDPKYRKQIENSSEILNNFLGVADKVQSCILPLHN